MIVVLVPDTVKLPLMVTSAPLIPNAVSNDEVKDLNEPVEVWIAFILVVLELVYVFKLLVVVCNVPITVLLELVYVFKLLVAVCNVPITVLLELVYVFNDAVVSCNEYVTELTLELNEFKLLVDVCNVPITVLLLPVYMFNEDIDPVLPSIDVNLPS